MIDRVKSREDFDTRMESFFEEKERVWSNKHALCWYIKDHIGKVFLDTWLERVEELKRPYFSYDRYDFDDYDSFDVTYDVTDVHETTDLPDKGPITGEEPRYYTVTVEFQLRGWKHNHECPYELKTISRVVKLDTMVNFHPKSFPLFWMGEKVKLYESFKDKLSKTIDIHRPLIDGDLIKWLGIKLGSSDE